MHFAQFLPLRLDDNELCGLSYGKGTYTTEGIVAICDMLKLNSSLTTLSYVPHSLNICPKCQDPLTVWVSPALP